MMCVSHRTACASHRTAWPAQSDQVLLPPHHPSKINGQPTANFFNGLVLRKSTGNHSFYR